MQSKPGSCPDVTRRDDLRKGDMIQRNMIGAYGGWAAGLTGRQPARLSFLNPEFKSLSAWRKRAAAKTLELIASPDVAMPRKVQVKRRFEYDGLVMEELSWQLPYGPRTAGLFMKPRGAGGRLPAVLAFHDHGGRKYFGVQKITRTEDRLHPMIAEIQRNAYGGVAWANELAKQGFAVLVHDAFLFGSRRVRYSDVSAVLTGDRVESDTVDGISEYNSWSAGHEHVMAKSLFCAGTTWPGVFLAEDRCALDYLCSRPDVDPDRVACGGLSGGGLRTVMLAGLDARIKAAFPVGFMSTWRDFLLSKSHTHTWMLYVPLLPNYLDFPEIIGLRAPLPTFVLNDADDPLYTLPEMRRADRLLARVYRKAGAPENYRCSFYPGVHKFDTAMQADAFAWLADLLK